MPIIKKPPEPHEHLDGDFGLDDLMALRAHFKGAGHGKNVFPGDSWKVLTRKHMKAHGLTPVEGSPASAESLNEQISAGDHPVTLAPPPESFSYDAPAWAGSTQPAWTGPVVTGDQAKAVWADLYGNGGAIPAASEFEAELGALAAGYAHGTITSGSLQAGVVSQPSWDFKEDHWVHVQPKDDGWVTYHHWPALPPHECPPAEPEWDISVWVTHADITNLEQAALAKAAAATKKAKWLQVIKGYHVTTLPEHGSLQAQNSAEQVQQAVQKGHTIAAHISVGWFPPAPGTGKKTGSPEILADIGQDLSDAAKALGIFKPAMTVQDMASALEQWATAKSKNGAAHPGCAFADHKDYKVVRDELVKAAKTLGVPHPATLSLTALAASIAVQVKAMDNQLDDVLAQLGIKPPPGAPAVSGVNAGKLIPSSLAPQPPEDGKGLTTGLTWTSAHALLKFAGGLEHDEATGALGYAALNKDGFHKNGIHVTSPDPNSYAAWFDPEPGDTLPVTNAAVVWKAKPKPTYSPDKGKFQYGEQLLMADIGEDTKAHLGGGECKNEHQASTALTSVFTYEQATGILAAAKKHQGHPLHVPAGNPKVSVLYNATMGKWCMKFYQVGDLNPSYPGMKEHQAVDALVTSGWYTPDEALVIVLQAKNNAKHEVTVPYVKVKYNQVSGLFSVAPTGKGPAQAKVLSKAEQAEHDKVLAQLTGMPAPLTFDELLGEAAGPTVKSGPASWDDTLSYGEAMFVLKNDSQGKFSPEDANSLLAAAKAKDGGLVVTPKVQVMWCSAGNHYHVGWPQPAPAAKPVKPAPKAKAKAKPAVKDIFTKGTSTGSLHGANTLNYSEALIKLKDAFGMSDSGASELLKNAQDEPGKLLAHSAPQGVVKVKWHLAGGHFHIWPGAW